MTRPQLVYLAAPYTHELEEVMHERERMITCAAAGLMSHACVVFSPITHGHAIIRHLPNYLLRDHGFWMAQCLPMLTNADVLMIFPLRGWRESKGLRKEIAHAIQHNIPIEIYQSHSFPHLEILHDEQDWRMADLREVGITKHSLFWSI